MINLKVEGCSIMEEKVIVEENQYELSEFDNKNYFYTKRFLFRYEDDGIDLNFENYKSIIYKTQMLRLEFLKTIKSFKLDEKEWDRKLMLNKSKVVRNFYLAYLELENIEENLKKLSLVQREQLCVIAARQLVRT